MRSVKTLVLALVPTCVVLAGAQHAVAAKFKVLYDFCAKANCADGSGPRGELYLNNSGELYGVTTGGGDNGRGVVFRLVPGSGDGKWKYQRLYSFCAKTDCRDGAGAAARLIPDAQGNLYGVSYNPSLVFVLKPNAKGTRW